MIRLIQHNKILSFAILLFLAESVWMQLAYATSYSDRLDLLFCTDLLVSGKKAYIDFFDSNPPLIFYIYSLPVWLARQSGLMNPCNLLVLYGVFITVCSSCLSIRILARHPQFSGHPAHRSGFFLLLLLIFISFTKPSYFADREPLFIWLVLPYLLRFMPSIESQSISRGLKVATALMAGIGFCIKPYCGIVFLGIQLFWVIRNKSFLSIFCLENTIIYSLVACYIFTIWQWTPEYIQIVMPMLMQTYYYIAIPSRKVILTLAAVMAMAIPLADFRLRDHSPYRSDILYLVYVAFLLLLYALSNANTGGHVFDPFMDIVLVLTGFLMLEYRYLRIASNVNPKEVQRFSKGLNACRILFAFYVGRTLFYMGAISAAASGVFDVPSGRDFMEQVQIINNGKKLQSFGTISEEFNFWVTLEYATGARWQTRFNCLWMLPAFFTAPAEFTAKNQWIPEDVANAYAEDLHNHRPELVFVEDRDDLLMFPHYVDLVHYFSRFPAFKKEWQHYAFVREINNPPQTMRELIPHVPGQPDDKNRKRMGYFVYKRLENQSINTF